MKIDLTGKTAIVTGSTKGIGRAAAIGLGETGANIVVTGRSREGVDEVVRSIGPKARGHVIDISTAEGCNALIAAEPDCDILVNNAGIFPAGDFFDFDDARWAEIFNLNMMAGVRLSRSYLRGMMGRNWGRIIFVSSNNAQMVPTNMIPYSVSKAAMLALSRGLAKRAAGTNVTVNAVQPGPTLSEGVETIMAAEIAKGRSLVEVTTERVKKSMPSSILGRFATSEEVANLIVYLASPFSSATVGAALRVDGGVIDCIT